MDLSKKYKSLHPLPVTRNPHSFLKGAAAIIVAISVSLILFYVASNLAFDDVIIVKYVVSEDKSLFNPTCSEIPDIRKYDCYPDAPFTEKECLNRGCCFSVPKDNISTMPGVPSCFYPSNYVGYIVKNVVQTSRRILAQLKRIQPSGFKADVKNLSLLVSFIDNFSLRVKITDSNSQRYEVPIQLHYQTEEITAPLYDVSLHPTSGLFTVRRKSTGSIIFQTNLSFMVYSDQFLQLSSDLPSKYVYGIGEHYDRMLRSVNWTRYTLINTDLAPVPKHGLYGSQPFYMSLDEDGNANGVLLFNSNIMDVILQPAPSITFRPIGGIFDFFIMMGASPNDVTKQYNNIIGKTFLPPFWSLGFHLCRFGYKTLNKTREVMQRNIDAGIPLDVQWNDIDYMDQYKDFTYDKNNFAGLPEFIDDIHAKGMHYVLMTDPGLSNTDTDYPPYDEGVDDDIFVKNANGSTFVGKVWTSGTTVFPDFSHPAATSFWTRQFQRLYDDVKFDGVWIDMNEPSNFVNGSVDGCPNSPLENPQYVPGGDALCTKTVCMSAQHYHTSHYNEHNIYGYREAVATNVALRNIRKKRPFIISRATFPGQGVYSGHWSGDVFSTWEDMRYTVSSLINFNLYGIPMVGSDICGFNDNTTVELCARWQSLGAFYPFARNHNERITIAQDPVALGPIVVDATKNSLKKRYALLPYLYTLFYRSHVFGDAVVRPLFFEFPKDMNTYAIDEQFLWGSSLMTVPVLYPNTTTVSAYFPEGVWYDDFGKGRKSVGERVTVNIPITDIHLYVRGGVIIPASIPNVTTTATRKNPFILAVALDEEQKACGELYWDDGESLETVENEYYNLIQFESSPGYLNSTIIKSGYQTDMKVKMIQFAGLKNLPSKVSVNGYDCDMPSNVLNDSRNMTEVNDLDMKKSGFFGIEAIPQIEMTVNIRCMCYQFENFFTIQVDQVSLLEPLSVEWT